MTRFILSFCAVFLLASCATILDRSTQEMHVETPGAEGAMCYLKRPGMLQKVYPPQTVRLTKTSDDMEVRCLALGNREKTVMVEAMMSSNVMLNISNGFILGALYDYDTGALFKYPEVVRVDFTGTEANAMPLPDYHKMLLKNPMLQDMEEFRPGKSALQRDRYNEPAALEKTERAIAAEETASDLGATDSDSGAAKSDGSDNSSSGSTSSAEELTRRMNPSVFGGHNQVDVPAAGSTTPYNNEAGDSGSVPIPLY